MRESAWKIEWDATGETPRVLLSHGDLMEGEIGRGSEALADWGTFDFAAGSVPAGRRNRKRRIEFARIDEHDTAAESWDACHTALLADPWGVKSYLSVSPLDGFPRVYLAAMASSTHAPLGGGPGPRSRHGYVFRVTPVSAVIIGGVIIVGGYFNDPAEYVFPPIPGGLDEGDEIVITGPGGSEGGYVIGGGGGLPPGGSGPVPVVPLEDPPALALVSAAVIAGENWPGGTVAITAPTVWENSVAEGGVWTINSTSTGVTAAEFVIPALTSIGAVVTFRSQAEGLLPGGGGTVQQSHSNALTVVAAPFENLSPPIITGAGVPGATLTLATAGEWQGLDSVSGEWYSWPAGGAATATGITAGSFDISAGAEDGDRYFYRETAVKAGADNQTADSNIIEVAVCDDCQLHPTLVGTVTWEDDARWSPMPMVFTGIAYPPGLPGFEADYCSYEGEAAAFAATILPEPSEEPYTAIYLLIPKADVAGQGQFLFRRSDGSYAGNDYFDLPGDCNEPIGTHAVSGLARNIDSITLADPEP